jgi:adenosylmethionine-8-amino-7-oxononanoate aminotransferase
MAKSHFPIWHPFTQHALLPDAEMIVGSDGAWLEGLGGRRFFDAISSWWVVTHGHRHPKIMEAIREQASTLDQVIFAGFTHEPAEKVARRLLAFVPAGLEHVFYSDSGSTAVEVAIKMALGYWRNTGEIRSYILALAGGYHGDTIGTMSAGARGVFSAAYEPLLYEVEHIPFPEKGREERTLDALDAACRRTPVAAFVVEPLILGAGGMRMYAPAVLAEMKRICVRHGVLLIADEVMTGFGRTGTMFACEQAGLNPDILCLAKGITGGALPLAATLSTKAIFDAHYSTDRAKTFFHSSSYTANPICCAAAAANLEIWADEPVLGRVAGLSRAQEESIERFRTDSRFSDVRRCGTVTALDIAVKDGGYLADVGPKLYAFFLSRGILLRPLGNTVYVMPPYCTTRDELVRVYECVSEAADHVSR